MVRGHSLREQLRQSAQNIKLTWQVARTATYKDPLNKLLGNCQLTSTGKVPLRAPPGCAKSQATKGDSPLLAWTRRHGVGRLGVGRLGVGRLGVGNRGDSGCVLRRSCYGWSTSIVLA